MKKWLLALILLLELTAFMCSARADSPLTSTDFHKAYLDIEIVKLAEFAENINLEIGEYLVDPQNPFDVKVAVVNALGWNIDGKSNAQSYLAYHALYRGLPLHAMYLDEQNRPEDYFIYAYLLAMDNYFEPDEALGILAKTPGVELFTEMEWEVPPQIISNKFSYAIVTALIKAQVVKSADFCKKWKTVAPIFTNKNLEQDLRPEAVKIIHNYMTLYKTDCNKKEHPRQAPANELPQNLPAPLSTTKP